MNKDNKQSKTLSRLLIIIILVLFVAAAMAFAAPTEGMEDMVTSLIRQFAAGLRLTPEQTAAIQSVMKASGEQMARDRAMFKNNEPALIEAAIRRRDMTEKHIQAVLEPGQYQKYPAVKELLSLDDSLVSLMETLAMSYPEAYRVAEIKRIENKQAELDRATYRKSAQALIATAIARRDMTDRRIEEFLIPEQQQKYQGFKQKREAERELFELKEGLILDSEQYARVEKILAEYRRDVPPDMRKKKGHIGLNLPGFGGPGGPGGGGGEMGGEMGGGGGMMPGGGGGSGMMPGGGGDMMPGGRGPGMGDRGGRGAPPGHMNDMMKKREAEKAQKIEVLLSPEQKERFLQIQQMRAKDMENRMLQMRGRMTDMEHIPQ